MYIFFENIAVKELHIFRMSDIILKEQYMEIQAIWNL
jgi:hypothetical protein